MNCKQGRFGAQCRWIERCLANLDRPSIYPERSLSKKAQVDELNSLIGKLAEARQNVQTESDMAWLEGTAQNLKQRVSEVLNCRVVA